VLDSPFLQGLEAALADWEVPAAAIGVSIAGREEIAAIGCEPSTVFRVASITKPFTALLAVSLLDLDADTGGVWAEDVRVRHLLAHTSGYATELPDIERFGEGDEALASLVAALPSVRRWVGSDVCWSYSNAGYWLAAGLCAEAAGRSYEDALAERIIERAGLESTSFGAPELSGTGADAFHGAYPRVRRASGGLVSNVPDLLRFGRYLLGEPQLRVVSGKPAGGVYGLGLFGERVGGVDVWGHTGSWGGFQTSLLVVPDRDAVFVGLTNGSRGSKALWHVEQRFFREAIGAERVLPPHFDVAPDVVQQLAGNYASEDASYVVEVDGGRLVATFPDGVFEARPIRERTFQIVAGSRIRERFDFPLSGFARFSSRLAARVA